ncbi:haloacid dehalogenase, partial [Pseudoalteromonas aliena]
LRSQGVDEVNRDVYRPAASNGAGSLLEAGFKTLWPKKAQSTLIKQLVDENAAIISKQTVCFSGVE